MEMAPAISSAKPPRTTSRAFPREDRPAVRAKGTVIPSERPMMASEIIRALGLKRPPLASGSLSVDRGGRNESAFWASRSRVELSLMAEPGLAGSSFSVTSVSFLFLIDHNVIRMAITYFRASCSGYMCSGHTFSSPSSDHVSSSRPSGCMV